MNPPVLGTAARIGFTRRHLSAIRTMLAVGNTVEFACWVTIWFLNYNYNWQ
jgi:hypothetical protein